MRKKFIFKARWVAGVMAAMALLYGSLAMAQFSAFQKTLNSANTKDAIDAANEAVKTGESTANPNTVPRVSVAAAASSLAAKCPSPLPSATQLKTALSSVVTSNKISRLANGGTSSTTAGGFDLDMWGVVVNRSGEVCAVVFTGLRPTRVAMIPPGQTQAVLIDVPNEGDVDNLLNEGYTFPSSGGITAATGEGPGAMGQQWLASRVIAAQKANTANAFSVPGFALSTANIFFPVQGGQSLFGLDFSNPVDTDVAYGGSASRYGTENDPMLGKKIGGVNTFGGGVALYATSGAPLNTPVLVGGLGVSGDTSCADHIVAWRTRYELNLDNVPGGVGAPSGGKTGSDNIIMGTVAVPDLAVSASVPGGIASTSGFGHPICGTVVTDTNAKTRTATAATGLVTGYPIGPNP